MSDESIKSSTTSDNSLPPGISFFDSSRIWVKFDGSCLKQDKVTFAHRKVVNLYIVYEIILWPFRRDDDFTLRNSLFDAIKLTKNAEKDKY